MEMKIIIEAVSCLVMLGGLIGIFIERSRSKRGIGVRVIQFLTITLLLPIILILSLEGILSDQTVATLLGAVVGYILSGIGKDENTT